MKQLWAPWRLEYVRNQTPPPGCLFCMAAAAQDDRSTLIIYRGQRTFVMLNTYPYNSGHVMVVPYRHHGRLGDLPEEDLAELMRTTELTTRAEDVAFHPEGFNIGLNLGRAAGAGITDHLHIHVVPRWIGDTNFMPVLSDVKVIPEHLQATYARLTEAFASLLSVGELREGSHSEPSR